jgi:transcriptional pleiotropic regulator of transition state genes
LTSKYPYVILFSAIYKKCNLGFIAWKHLRICNYYSPIHLRKGGNIVKSTGIVRRLDELGRITLPIELRRTLDVNERDPLEIFVEEGKIILQKYEPTDIFTGSKDNLIEYQGKKVSRETVLELAKLAGIVQ